jgi:glycolate oxidase subunit GlcD
MGPAMMKVEAFNALKKLFDTRQLVTDPVELITYEVDAGLNRGKPEAVFFPETTEDICRLAQWAAENEVPLVARSSGTGLSGGAVALHGGVVISFSRMNHVLDVNETDRLVKAEPGVINLAMDTRLKKTGFYFPPDPASQRASALGGNIAENAGGPHCFKYGVTSNYVRGLEIVLASGAVVHSGGSTRDLPEYDLTGLLCGSEGTLGIVSSATLGIVRSPTGFKTLLATFPSIEQAGRAVSAVIAKGLVPATLEMMDRNIARVIEDYAHAGFPTEAAALLLAEVDGYPESLDAQVDEIIQVLEAQGVEQVHVCRTAEEREKIWLARKSAFGAMARISPAYFQLDGTVPRSRLAETLAEINALCAGLGLTVAYVFHAGDGNLHPLIPFDPSDEEMERRVHQAGDAIMAICVSKNGTISGEHGIGIEKRKYMPLMFGGGELAAMQEVKEVFDPGELLNPGKIFPESSSCLKQPENDPILQPAALFTPRDEKEAAGGMRAAQQNGTPVFINRQPGGGRVNGEVVVLSTAALDGIDMVSSDDLYAEVEAGVNLAGLQLHLLKSGLWVPIASPWEDDSTVGGMVSNGYNSPLQMRYGPIRDQVMGMHVILPDGRSLHLGRPVIKNVAGYDLGKLFIGAHGTLGLITRVTLKLMAQPRMRKSLVIQVPGWMEGIKLGEMLHHQSLVASAILICASTGLKNLPWQPYNLIYTVEGHERDVEVELRAARELAGGDELENNSGLAIWKQTLAGMASILRIGLPPSRMSDFILQHPDLPGTTLLGDLANGMLYIQPTSNEQASGLRVTAGTCGGYAVLMKSGPGNEIDTWGYTPETLPLIKKLKSRWDPNGILNPGAFLV